MEHFGNTHILLPMVQGQDLTQEMAKIVEEMGASVHDSCTIFVHCSDASQNHEMKALYDLFRRCIQTNTALIRCLLCLKKLGSRT